MTDEQIIARVRGMLTPQDLRVAEIMARYIDDDNEGYGGAYDGMEATIIHAQGWLMAQVAGMELPKDAGHVDGTTWIPGDTSLSPPWGKRGAPVLDDSYGMRVWKAPMDGEDYSGLNEDPDCAAAELIGAVSYAYQFYARDYGWELFAERPKYLAMMEGLSLDPDKCNRRTKELERLYQAVLKGKHDRNETTWV